MNDKGSLTGYYYYSGYEGFVRDRSGAYTTFTVPGATDGTLRKARSRADIATSTTRCTALSGRLDRLE